MVGGIATAHRLGKAGSFGQLRPDLVREHVEDRNSPTDATAQYRLEPCPEGWAPKRKPVGSALQDRIGSLAVNISDVFSWTEFDRCQKISIVGIWESLDVGLPTSRSHRDAKVVEDSPTTDERFPPGAVGILHPPRPIDVQVQPFALTHPAPRLAVVHRRRPARQQH